MAAGALAELGRMPTSRKVLVFAVIGLMLGGLYYRFIYSSLSEDVDQAAQSYEAAVGAHDTATRNLKKYEELKPEMARLLTQLAKNQAALPTEAEVPAFFEMLERKVRESGVEISKWLKRAEEPIERFVKVPVDIEITGTFMQIKRFFASLVQRDVSPEAAEERERIVSIESLVLAQPQVRDRAIILTAKFTAVTFRQDERAAGKPGGPRAPAAPAPLRPSEPQGPRAEAGAGASDSARRASAEPRAQGGS